MQWLIDGYNVMYAGGRLGPALSRDGFRRARRRFLDEIVAALGPDGAARTTVVFDALVHPGDFKVDTHYRELGVIFALGDENADARIEQIIAAHSNPKTLTVVSSDRRIRQAAARRRTRCLTAEQFWELIDECKEQKGRERKAKPARLPATSTEDQTMKTEEAALWLEAFRDVDQAPGVKEGLAPDDSLLTDADIAEIQREIEREQRGRLRP
jgi:predicted RNA-binding protein with PIN domain